MRSPYESLREKVFDSGVWNLWIVDKELFCLLRFVLLWVPFSCVDVERY